MLVTLLFAAFFAVYSQQHPPRVDEILKEIECGDLTWAEDFTAVTHDPRGVGTKYFAPITGGYFIQTNVITSMPHGALEVVDGAVIQRTGLGSWRYIFPICVNNEVLWEYGDEPDDPFEYHHSVLKKGELCECPDCSEKLNSRR